MSNIYGISQYQRNGQTVRTAQGVGAASEAAAGVSAAVGKKSEIQNNSSAIRDFAEVKAWKPVAKGSPLVPSQKTGYGMVIGEAELTDRAREYYGKLKSKFHGMEFILVGKDMKSQVAANAAAYGNASKQVVLIDEEKLERMATDESFRKKYEGIISMSQMKLQAARGSLISSGARVTNFGMSVSENGETSFFATVEKMNETQTKRLAKKQAEKKAAKQKEKKADEKAAREARLDQTREARKAAKDALETARMKARDASDLPKEYVKLYADTIESLLDKVSDYACNDLSRSVRSEAETAVGQRIDLRG